MFPEFPDTSQVKTEKSIKQEKMDGAGMGGGLISTV